MPNIKPIIDVDGNSLAVGDNITLVTVTDELLNNLPTEDKTAIKNQIGKTMTIQSVDEFNNIELEFKDREDSYHFIWVNPSCVKKTT